MCASRDMVAFVPPFWEMVTCRTVRVSVRDNRGFNIFRNGLRHYSQNTTLYNIYQIEQDLMRTSTEQVSDKSVVTYVEWLIWQYLL
jgi:hypothetical protein